MGHPGYHLLSHPEISSSEPVGREVMVSVSALREARHGDLGSPAHFCSTRNSDLLRGQGFGGYPPPPP